MKMSPAKILVVDDKENMLSLFRRILPGHEVTAMSDGARALSAIEAGERFDLIVSDVRMPGVDGLLLLQEAKRIAPDTEVILMTAYADVQDALGAIRAGAYDYLMKPFDPDQAAMTVERALERKALREKARTLQDSLDYSAAMSRLLGGSFYLTNVISLLNKASNSDIGLLLIGERGVGKRIAARAVHDNGARRKGPFVVADCGAFPVETAEEELFGGARPEGEKAGAVEEARGGTLFLERVERLSPSAQVHLLRAIEDRKARRIGGVSDYDVNVRTIAATDLDLRKEVEKGSFREDLYYRLAPLRILLAPLRDRPEDVPDLAALFAREAAENGEPPRIAAEALKALTHYHWPGNLPELRSVMERAAAVCAGKEIGLDDLPVEVASSRGDGAPADRLTEMGYMEAVTLARDQMSRRYLDALLKLTQGNVSAAADRAKIGRESVHRLLRKYGVDPNKYRPL